MDTLNLAGTKGTETKIPQPIHHSGTTSAGSNLSSQLYSSAAEGLDGACWFQTILSFQWHMVLILF